MLELLSSDLVVQQVWLYQWKGCPHHVGHVESRSVRLEMVLVLVQDRCMICTKRTIGSDIVLDAADGTAR